MYIQEVTLEGFKTFPTKTTIGPFHPRFNAIVGLNGSGKSNILDAICFLLGTSNLSQLRIQTMQDLVYKHGQTGVTKATVTVRFNNSDKEQSPPLPWKKLDVIEITRQIVIGGRNRVMLNGRYTDTKEIRDLFQSVQLNIDNPHFLIMQGSIPKLINAKPMELLSMLEEASGTSIWEKKSKEVVKRIEKKQNKLDEINAKMKENGEQLQTLEAGQAQYMKWAENEKKTETLHRLCEAHDYFVLRHSLENAESDPLAIKKKQLEDAVSELTSKLTSVEEELAALEKERDYSEQVALKNCIAEMEKELCKKKADRAYQKSEADAAVGSKKEAETRVKTLEKSVKGKETSMKETLDKIKHSEETLDDLKKQKETAERTRQALFADCTANDQDGDTGPTLKEQLEACEAETSTRSTAVMKLDKEIKHLEKSVSAAEKQLQGSNSKWDELVAERQGCADHVESLTKKLEKLQKTYEPSSYKKLTDERKEQETKIQQSREQIEILSQDLSFIDIIGERNDPAIKGAVARLVSVKTDMIKYATALEVAAGGRLYNVVVDTDDTGSRLLRESKSRRITVIPLNKIDSKQLPAEVFKAAQQVAQKNKSTCVRPLDVLQFAPDIQKAVEFVFGGNLLCTDNTTAKEISQLAAVKKHRVRVVTTDGSVYDPTGSLTGGAAAGRKGVFAQLHKLSQSKADMEDRVSRMKQVKQSIDAAAASAELHQSLTRELEMQRCQLEMIEDRLKNSERHSEQTAHKSAVARLQECKSEFASLSEALRESKERQTSLANQIQDMQKGRAKRELDLEKRIKTLNQRLAENEKILQNTRAASSADTSSLDSLREELNNANASVEEAAAALKQQEIALASADESFNALQDKIKKKANELKELEKSTAHADAKVSSARAAHSQCGKELQEATREMQRTTRDYKHQVGQQSEAISCLEKRSTWLLKERQNFGIAGGEFDFRNLNMKEQRATLEVLQQEQSVLSKSVNKKVVNQYEKLAKHNQEMVEMRDAVTRDRNSIEKAVVTLNKKRLEALSHACETVNDLFGSIFSRLLPFANAKLEHQEGRSIFDGLEMKVAFGGVWQTSLNGTSGGQKSLMALSLLLAMLKFNPAPVYILDEVDAALDVNHTKNLGSMIKNHFPDSQFLIISHGEGLYCHADVLFRTSQEKGISSVHRSESDAAVRQTEPLRACTSTNAAPEEEFVSGAKAVGTKRRRGQSEEQENAQPV